MMQFPGSFGWQVSSFKSFETFTQFVKLLERCSVFFPIGVVVDGKHTGVLSRLVDRASHQGK
jgi:hypothetical protein